MSKLRWLVVAIVAVAAVAVIGPFAYIHFIEGPAPARLSLSDVTTTTAGAGAKARTTLDGRWSVTTGSKAGYRVQEVLFGQHAEAVGRTSSVTGSMTIAGTKVTDATFTVDLTTVASDQDRRDGQFQGRIMDTSHFPKATFTLTAPIDLGTVPSDGTKKTMSATGDLTVHGVKRSVTFDLDATKTGSSIAVNGTLPVKFSDFNISDPSFGPAVVQDHGEIEVLLVFGPSA